MLVPKLPPQDVGGKKLRDDVGFKKRMDDGGGFKKSRDDGPWKKRLDDVKNMGFDVPPGVEGMPSAAVGTGTGTPFILATPHHAHAEFAPAAEPADTAIAMASMRLEEVRRAMGQTTSILATLEREREELQTRLDYLLARDGQPGEP
jgi:hypothetical protein